MNGPQTLADARAEKRSNADYDDFRASVYRLLGSLLSSPPSAELLAWLAGLELFPGADSPMVEAWSGLQRAARQAEPQEVADEYQNLFIGLGKGEVLPYASWYKTGFLMEVPLVGLRRDLRALGFELEEGVHEPEDHIAALCQVMSMLADPAQGHEATQQRRFFAAHLKDWHGRFFADLQGCPSARFYAAVGGFGAVFLNLEGLYTEA